MRAIKRLICRWKGHKVSRVSELFRGNEWLVCERCEKWVDLPMRFPAATPKGGAK